MKPEQLDNLNSKRNCLLALVKSYGRVAVALSGGVDSAVVAKAAAIACGEKSVAITANSPSLAIGELDCARNLCATIGIRHRVIETSEFESAGYQKNAGDRCYYCKTELYNKIQNLAPVLDVDVICSGANLDDLGDHRPGMIAAEEHAVRSPLVEAGIDKATVRAIAKAWELDVWDKPAMPCLSSRVAYGVEVTPDRVRRINLAEAYLKEHFAFHDLRVRLEVNDLARIEVPFEEIPKLMRQESIEQVVEHFKKLGFNYVTVDLEGFRSGNMNDALPIVELTMH